MSSTLQSFGIPRDLGDLYQEMHEALAAGRIAFDGNLPLSRGSTSLESVLQQLVAGAQN